jgi:hypothetical protein
VALQAASFFQRVERKSIREGATSHLSAPPTIVRANKLPPLLFNPKEVDLRVGENLSLRENGSDRGLIVQVIEFRTVSYPSLLAEMMALLAEETAPPDFSLAALPAEGLPENSKLKLAIAKIRKVVTWTSKSIPQAQLATV